MQISDILKITTCFSFYTKVSYWWRHFQQKSTYKTVCVWDCATESIWYWQRTFYSSQKLAIKHHHSRCWLLFLVFLN